VHLLVKRILKPFPFPHHCGISNLPSTIAAAHNQCLSHAVFKSILDVLGQPLKTTWRTVQPLSNCLHHFLTQCTPTTLLPHIQTHTYLLAINWNGGNASHLITKSGAIDHHLNESCTICWMLNQLQKLPTPTNIKMFD
jgi:hypothetical protein